MVEAPKKKSGKDSDEDYGQPTVKYDRTQSFDPKALAEGNRESISMSDALPGVKKAGTILSPHLEVLDSGGMIVHLDNMDKASPRDKPLTGRIKIWLSEPFEPANLTILITGFLRSQLAANVPANSAADDEVTRLARTLVNVEYTLATFEEGIVGEGMMEFPFSINLPEEIDDSLMLNFGKRSASKCFFLRAQMHPKNPIAFSTRTVEDISILRTDMPLFLY